MSEADACSFVFDPKTDSEQGTNSPLSDVWECPHEPYGQQEYCPYHLSEEQRQQMGLTSEAFRQRFIDDIEQAGQTSKEFIGADLSGLNLRYATLSSADEYPINIAHATVDGVLDLTSASVTQPLFLAAASIKQFEASECRIDRPLYLIGARVDELDLASAEIGSLEMQGASFEGEINLRNASIASGLRCQNAVFDGYTRMEGISCVDTVTFRGAIFRNDADFDGGTIESLDLREVVATRLDLRKLDLNGDLLVQDAKIGIFDIGRSTIDGQVSLKRSRIDGAAELRDVSFRRLDISQTSFGSAVHLGQSEIHDELVGRNCEIAGLFDASYAEFGRVVLTGAGFNGAIQFRHCEFRDDTSFGSVEFRSSVDFTDSSFHDNVTFVRTEFCDQATFEDCRMHDCVELQPAVPDSPLEIRFERANLTRGEIHCREALRYNLTGATLGDIVFDASDVLGTCFDHLRILDTEFDGFDFGRYKQELREVGWGLHSTSVRSDREDNNKVSLGLLESTYLKAKNGAKQVGDNKAAAEFFRREMAYRRKQHASIAMSAAESTVAQAVSTGRWIANGTLSLTAGYGERPSRVFAASIAIVLIFSTIYATVLEFPATAGAYGERYVLFSLQSFVTFIVGSPADESVGVLVQFLSAVQGFIGAFFVALFVFALTRSIHR